MKTSILVILSAVIIAFVAIVSASLASVIMSIVTLCIGVVLVHTISSDQYQVKTLTQVLLFSFILVTFFVLMEWLSINNDIRAFMNEDNDHYKFYLASQEGQSAKSISDIFNNCIYIENGGYYFLLQLIAYLASTFLDGNCIMLQQLGTAACCIWTSVFLAKTLFAFAPSNKVKKYSYYYVAFSPLLLNSLGIHRDPHIAFLYMILIYITFCKKVSFFTVIIQLMLAFVLYHFRQQHGLFSISFVGLSLLLTQRKSKWAIVIVLALLGVFGGTFAYSFIADNFTNTNTYYDAFRVSALSGLDSGLGRYVYQLPSPLRELMQIIVLQMRFPPWGGLETASSIYSFIIGIEVLLVAVFWFYIFVSLIAYLFKTRLTQIQKPILYSILFMFIFLLLNSSNLDTRRVVCMYPLFFLPYVYLKENVITNNYIKLINKRFVTIYAFLCIVYFITKLLFG